MSVIRSAPSASLPPVFDQVVSPNDVETSEAASRAEPATAASAPPPAASGGLAFEPTVSSAAPSSLRYHQLESAPVRRSFTLEPNGQGQSKGPALAHNDDPPENAWWPLFAVRLGHSEGSLSWGIVSLGLYALIFWNFNTSVRGLPVDAWPQQWRSDAVSPTTNPDAWFANVQQMSCLLIALAGIAICLGSATAEMATARLAMKDGGRNPRSPIHAARARRVADLVRRNVFLAPWLISISGTMSTSAVAAVWYPGYPPVTLAGRVPFGGGPDLVALISPAIWVSSVFMVIMGETLIILLPSPYRTWRKTLLPIGCILVSASGRTVSLFAMSAKWGPTTSFIVERGFLAVVALVSALYLVVAAFRTSWLSPATDPGGTERDGGARPLLPPFLQPLGLRGVRVLFEVVVACGWVVGSVYYIDIDVFNSATTSPWLCVAFLVGLGLLVFGTRRGKERSGRPTHPEPPRRLPLFFSSGLSPPTPPRPPRFTLPVPSPHPSPTPPRAPDARPV